MYRSTLSSHTQSYLYTKRTLISCLSLKIDPHQALSAILVDVVVWKQLPVGGGVVQVASAVPLEVLAAAEEETGVVNRVVQQRRLVPRDVHLGVQGLRLKVEGGVLGDSNYQSPPSLSEEQGGSQS